MSVNLKEPILPDGRRWQQWALSELYIADDSESGAYVPNVGDLVTDLETRTQYVVSYRNPQVPYDFKLEPFAFAYRANTETIDGDLSPIARDAYKVLINKERAPATLNLMSQWATKGSANSYIRVFKGTDISNNGICISGYMQNGKLVSDRIPLELAYVGNTSNKTLKHAVPGICTVIPEQGERLTVVVYNDVNDVTEISHTSALITNLSMVIDKPLKRITDIRLVSPHMSTSRNDQVELPLNVPVDDLLFTCEVVYATGKKQVPVDGKRVKLQGIKTTGAFDNKFISSTLGIEIPLILSYRLADDESYIGDSLVDGVVNRRYSAITERVDGAYSPKLFVVPKWRADGSGYRLEYYLTDLRRNGVYYATAYVRQAENSPAFDPLLYGVVQRIAVRVNTAEVSPTFKDHYHTEAFSIVLHGPGTDAGENFTIEYVKESPKYGVGVYATFQPYNVTYNQLNITCGKASLQEWLAAVYATVYPVYDPSAESAPPTPTHFELVVNNRGYRYPITDWLKDLVVDTPIKDGDSLYIQWVMETAADDLYLGVSPMLLHEQI